MHADTNEPRVTPPGRLTDDVAILAQGGFRQLDDAGHVQVAEPEGVAIEDALVVIDDAGGVPVERPELIDGGAEGTHLVGVSRPGISANPSVIEHFEHAPRVIACIGRVPTLRADVPLVQEHLTSLC